MQKTTLSIRVIYILTSIVYYLAIFSTSLGIIIAFALLFDLNWFSNDMNLAIKMPVAVNFNEVGTVNFLGSEVKAQILEASGQIQLFNTPVNVRRMLAVTMIIVFPLLFWLVFLIHRFMRNVSEGKIFEAKNFYILRKLSFGLAGIWLLTIVYMQILRFIMLEEFGFAGLSLSSDKNWYAGVLFAALFIWVLSHVFLKGLELQKENELTI